MSRVRPLNPPEVIALWESIEGAREVHRERAVLALCIDSGGLRSEIAHLTRGDLDLDNGALTIGAGSRRRTVRLGEMAMAALREMRGHGDHGDALVRSRNGHALTVRTVHEQLKRLGELSGVGDWISCRHTRRTWLAETIRADQMPFEVIVTLAGHQSARGRRASPEEALAAQLVPGWESPLDRLLASGSAERLRRAA